MQTRGRGRMGQAGSASGGCSRGRDGQVIGRLSAPGSRGADKGQSSRGRRTVRPRSASLQTRWTCRRHANTNAGPSERWSRMTIWGDQIYVGRTRHNPKILQHPLMALRLVMLLRTIVDQILMERWKEQQPIVCKNHNCNCCRDLYWREKGACGEPTKAFKSYRPLRIYYDKGLNNAEKYAAFLRHVYDENEAIQGQAYAVSGDSFDPSESSSSCADRDMEQWELNGYAKSMPSKPADYMSDEDTSSDSGNGFENLCQDWSKNEEWCA